MEGQDLSPPHVDTSRPSLGFPLGTALLLIIIFSLSGIFSCCYHWDKLRTLRQSHSSIPALSHTQSPPSTVVKGESLPVLMPGDEVPKFIAMPCPCHPSRPDKIIVTVQHPPLKPPLLLPFY
ncbi:uncharacterized protein At5g65660 [Cajanus cajan]|uniref:Uncharacterized protein At5g65660 family n=1 Tax=Cajanus cajan TaxID=3821 RepID=A0A151TH82_CAJCA|nr:uncharacterized protein At5g65660 [Cajanus cajan]KYP66388.1 Uncharacterized protein At5g65660 family [Cajanus cajan]